MMNYRQFLDFIAKEFLAKIEKLDSSNTHSIEPIETEDFQKYADSKCEWKNYRYVSSVFRMAHVERYSDDKIHVLHFTTFPRERDPSPIFGFDVIATDKKVLGCYFDLSPVLKTWGDGRNYSRKWFDRLTKETFEPFDKYFTERKPVPDWAEGIFSEKACFFEPQNDLDFASFCYFSLNAYSNYMYQCLGYDMRINNNKIVSIQNRYCEVQAKNPRTFGVLKSKIGEEKARYFMEKILFPKIKK